MFSAAANVSSCCLRGNLRRTCLLLLQAEEAETGFDPFMGLFADPLCAELEAFQHKCHPRASPKI